VSVVADEFHFERSPGVVRQDDGTDIASDQAVSREIVGEGDGVEFMDGMHFRRRQTTVIKARRTGWLPAPR
jgi:hypothetical protein